MKRFTEIVVRGLACALTLCCLSVLICNRGAAQNLLSNSDFERGRVGALPEGWGSQKEGGAEGRVLLTDKEAHSGSRCLLIEHTNDGGYIHENKSVDLEKGYYRFSLWAKSNKDAKFLAQIYRRTDWSTPLSRTCKLKGGRWTRFEFFLAPAEPFPASIQIGLTERGKLYLDDVELVRLQPPQMEGVKVWDTVKPLEGALPAGEKSKWKPVARGSEGFQPRGDLVVESGLMSVLFNSRSGTVALHSRNGSMRRRIVLKPLAPSGKGSTALSCIVNKTSESECVVSVEFSNDAGEKLRARFTICRAQTIRVDPDDRMKRLDILGEIELAIVPDFIADDLIFSPRDWSSERIAMPPAEMFIGLLRGGDAMLVLAWHPNGGRISVLKGDDKSFGGAEFRPTGRDFSLALLTAAGIWHRQKLDASFLEKDVKITWKRPFPAKWVTYLDEDDVKTRFRFRDKREKIWRAGRIGNYVYPVWFEGEDAFVHLSKRIPPRDEAVIYFVERSVETPPWVIAPVDVLRKCLTEGEFKAVFDEEGREMRSLRREHAAIGAATCGVTSAIEKVFKAGEETEKREYIMGGVDDMIYFIKKQRERIEEYVDFARSLIDYLKAVRVSKPQLVPVADEVEKIARRIFDEYEKAKENIKDIEYVRQIAAETNTLTLRKNPENLKAFLKLKSKWRGVGGAQDGLVRIFHTITRSIFQQAGYLCARHPEAIDLADEIRKRCRRCLRNPDGYEIWSDY